jgi:hypothetical protein
MIRDDIHNVNPLLDLLNSFGMEGGEGHGEWGVGSGEWGVGSGEWGVGSGEWGVGRSQILIGENLRRIEEREIEMSCGSSRKGSREVQEIQPTC